MAPAPPRAFRDPFACSAAATLPVPLAMGNFPARPLPPFGCLGHHYGISSFVVWGETIWRTPA